MDRDPQYTHTSATHPWLKQLMASPTAHVAPAAAPASVSGMPAEALAAEIVQVLRYRRHHYATGGAHPRSVGERTLPQFSGEQAQAALIIARLAELHGGLDFAPNALVSNADGAYMEGKSLRDMIRENLAAERASIDIYGELIRRFGADDPGTRGMLEAVVATEQGHASHLERLLAASPRSD
jgi:bacterioferritin